MAAHAGIRLQTMSGLKEVSRAQNRGGVVVSDVVRL